MRGPLSKACRRLAGLPHWLRAGRADWERQHRRRLTPAYRARRRRVRSLWIGAGLLVLWQPSLPVVLVVGLLTALMSFAILDPE